MHVGSPKVLQRSDARFVVEVVEALRQVNGAASGIQVIFSALVERCLESVQSVIHASAWNTSAKFITDPLHDPGSNGT